MLCWAIWEARNQKLWKNITSTPRTIVEGARSLWRNWVEAQNLQPSSAQPHPAQDGNFIAALCTPWKGKLLVKEAEALGVREALSWIKQLNYTHVEVEMDAANVLHEINHPQGFSPVNVLIHDVKEIARSANLLSGNMGSLLQLLPLQDIQDIIDVSVEIVAPVEKSELDRYLEQPCYEMKFYQYWTC
nr:uncharacterized protein LOC109164833 [Ipomoea trifida]